MPSDDTATRVLAVLAPAIEAFRSAVTDAAEALRTQLDAQLPAAGRAERTAGELGAFAEGRIDAARFAELLDMQPAPDPRALALLERARSELAIVAAARAAPFRVRVPAGGDLIAEVGVALAVAGRAFCAARVAELVRTGRTREAAREDLVAGLPFARWTRGELRIAPPLLVEVGGEDLQVAGLAAFLDGAQKFVLIARPPAPPAPLVRLITPNILVMQCTDVAELGRLAAFDGPAVAALVPEGCATFVHDPGNVPSLTVTSLPDAAPAARVGRSSAFQQNEDLALLRMLTEAAKPEPAPANAPAPQSAPALAAWLLQQADLTGIA